MFVLFESNFMTDSLQDVAIIGGGPAGLSVARALSKLNIPFMLYEKHSDVGGLWDMKNEGSPIYESAHFISSKTTSGNVGFPMSEHYPDYPSYKQILSYIRSYASFLNLGNHLKLNTKVIDVVRENNRWQVTSETGGEQVTKEFGYIVCASGTNWFPNIPSIKGQESFSGEIIHSVDYKSSESLKGKSVVIVGAGNSAVDIACDAAIAAKQCYISMRRGYHFIPKHLFGEPVDVFSERHSWLPVRVQQSVLGLVLKILNGDLSKFGLKKPDHKLLESHPILNTQILHYLQHGRLIAKPDIDYIDKSEVVFKNGTRVEADLIILATGYNWSLPYMKDEYFDWVNSRPKAFMKVFNPKEPTLFVNGFIEVNSSAYKLFDDMGLLIAHGIDAQIKGGKTEAAFQAFIQGEEPPLSGKVNYVKSDRHTNYVNRDAFRKAMANMQNKLGWPNAEKLYNQ